jgi:predicted Zn-dependent protease
MTDYVHDISDEESAKIASFLRWLAFGTALFVLLIVALFITADGWLRLISPQSERRFIEPYIEWSRENLLFESEPELQAYVESITNDLYARLDTDERQMLEVQVVRGDTINAFATLGGYVFVFEGLLRAVDNENSLAMVLAHEIAHVHNRDPLLGTGRGMLLELAISSLSGSGVNPRGMDASTDVMLNTYSRDQELAADEIAVSLLQQKYGHVGGASRLFEIIDDDENEVESAEFLSTHPDIDARIENIEALSAEHGWDAAETVAYPPEVQEALGR